MTTTVRTARRRPWTSRLTPAAVAASLIALSGLFASVKFRIRDPLLSVQGAIDSQILIELAVWGVAGAWVLAEAVSSDVRWTLARPRHFGTGLGVLALFVFSAAVATLYSTSPLLALVRATQWIILIGLGAVSYIHLKQRRDLMSFWLTSRRVLLAFAVLATVATFAFPFWDPFHVDFGGAARFRWFAMAPVGAGGVIGVCLVLAMGTALGVEDPLFQSRWGRIAKFVLVAGLGLLLGATKSRGAMIASVAAVGVLFLTYPRAQARQLAGLAAVAGGGLLATGVAAPLIEEYILRGQTAEALGTLTGRTDLAAAALPLIQDRIWFGYGFMSARAEFLDLEWGAGEAHNMVLGMLFSRGVVGLSVLVLLVVVLARNLHRTRNLQRIRTEPMGVESGLVRELKALATYILIVGLVTEAISGAPGIYGIVVLWIALLSDRLLDRELQSQAGVP